MKFISYILTGAAVMLLASCAGEEFIPAITSTDKQTIADGTTDGGEYLGFYVLNEGNMGANKCTLDFYDYTNATYYRNIYADNNPTIAFELGDSGNDMAIYRDRLYIVVTGSHKVEVLDARTAHRIGQVDISSPRCIAFSGNKAFVTSEVGAGDKGTVVAFDIETLQVSGSVAAGYSPEGITERDGRLYVANSYNYGAGAFDNTITVVDAATLRVEYTTEAGTNLRSLLFDNHSNLWAIASGNYFDRGAELSCLTPAGKEYKYAGGIAADASSFVYYKDYIYTVGVGYDQSWNATPVYTRIATAAQFDKVKKETATWNGADIQTPYNITVNSSTGEFYITDARNYTSSGRIYAFGPKGSLLWSATTGDIPAKIAFLRK